jgi:ribonuclease HI
MTIPKPPTSNTPAPTPCVVTLRVRVSQLNSAGHWAFGYMDEERRCKVEQGTIPARKTCELTRAESMVAAFGEVLEHVARKGPVLLDVDNQTLRVALMKVLRTLPGVQLSMEKGPEEQLAAVTSALDLAAPVAPAPLPLSGLVIATDASINSNGIIAGLGWVVSDGAGTVLACGKHTRTVTLPGDILLGEMSAIRRAVRDVKNHRFQGRLEGGLTILSDSRPALGLIKKVRGNIRGTAAHHSGAHLQEAKAVLAEIGSLPAVFQWVRGHSGHRMNEAADRLAVMARRNLEFGISEATKTRMLEDFHQEMQAAMAA